MTPERQNALYERYAQLLVHRPGQGLHLPMHFGIECGDGWFDLVDRLLRLVQFRADHGGAQPAVLQIKQKFGSLKVYWRDADGVVDGMTAYAQDLSKTVCEVCGEAGTLLLGNPGPFRTRCAAHADIWNPDEPDDGDRHPRRRRPAASPPAPESPPDQALFDAALLMAHQREWLPVALIQRRLKIGIARATALRDAVLATLQRPHHVLPTTD